MHRQGQNTILQHEINAICCRIRVANVKLETGKGSAPQLGGQRYARVVKDEAGMWRLAG